MSENNVDTNLLPAKDEELGLGAYARQAYLEYALSVVKGRALPDICDGQKPVQRRILYSMSRMGLGFGGANGAVGARPVKSARVVADYIASMTGIAYEESVRIISRLKKSHECINYLRGGKIVITDLDKLSEIAQAEDACCF